MRVGLLEDDIAIQEMLQLVLQDEGYAVTTYPTAEECLEVFQQQEHTTSPVEIMIVDWRLSGPMTGVEVIFQLRSDNRYQVLPIILTTAATFNDTDALQHLHISLLEKPFSVDDMLALIKVLTGPAPTA